MHSTEDTAIITAIETWIRAAVIGLNLCPFARTPFTNGQVRYVACRPPSPEVLLDAFAQELTHLAQADPATCETTVLIVADAPFAKRFRDFNDLTGVAEDLLVELGFEGELQLASFHPQFQFAGTLKSDVSNFTNRAPYPVWHLLRESSVSRAVDAMVDPDAIYERNISTLRSLEEAQLTSLFGTHAMKSRDG